jgi:superfamily II RNA helicase
MGAYGVAGDPAGMRRLAAVLRREADLAGLAGGQIAKAVQAMVFEGPAADRFKGQIGWAQMERQGLVTRLHDLADRLLRAAAEVEAEQERARLRELERERAEQAERAAQAAARR